MRPPFRAAPVMLPRVQRIRRGDRVLCYHRPTGTRLPDLPETHPEFIAAWARAEATKPDHAPPVPAGTITAAIRALRASAKWRALSAGYRTALRHHIDQIETDHGTLPIRGLRARHLEADLAALDANPANARLKSWRLIMAQAKAAGTITDDPSAAVSKRRAKTAGHTAWTAAEVQQVRDRWPVGTRQRAALELLAWTGARVSDASRLTLGNIGTDGLLTFRQQKTGGMAYVPWTCALPTWAQRWETERMLMRDAVTACAGFTLLETSLGRARTVKGLSNLISDAATAAGLTGRSAHGLRKFRLTAIAESGGTAHAIMSWGGHAALSEAEHYTRSANRRALVMGTEQDQNAVNVSTGGSKRAEK